MGPSRLPSTKEVDGKDLARAEKSIYNRGKKFRILHPGTVFPVIVNADPQVFRTPEGPYLRLQKS